MHILYIHQHFSTLEGKTGTRSYEFARRWVKAGHKVTLITGCYDIGGLKSAGGLYQRNEIESIDVVMVKTGYGNKQSYLRRILSFCSFCIFAILAGRRVKDVDVIYATSTPLSVGIPAIILSRFRHVPFIFEVRDQWPEIPIQMGIIKNKVLIKLLLWFEKFIYLKSSTIVALSPGIADAIRDIIKDKKTITVIPNSCDIDLFKPQNDGSAIRQQHNWDDKLVLMHFGAMGKANGLDFIVDAAQRLQTNKDIRFVLLGDGGEKHSLIEKVRQLGLNNVEILDSVPKKDLPGFVAACDVSMVVFANYPILENNSANKFFDSLSAGKPVILNYSGWQRNILENNNAGFGCDLCNIEQFIEKLLYLNLHRDKLVQMGQNARKIAVEEFSRDKQASELLCLLKKYSTPIYTS
jgi:glycosyltransferase involved in cell wall biosynthesis